jgi:hypothetical protein
MCDCTGSYNLVETLGFGHYLALTLHHQSLKLLVYSVLIEIFFKIIYFCPSEIVDNSIHCGHFRPLVLTAKGFRLFLMDRRNLEASLTKRSNQQNLKSVNESVNVKNPKRLDELRIKELYPSTTKFKDTDLSKSVF